MLGEGDGRERASETHCPPYLNPLCSLRRRDNIPSNLMGTVEDCLCSCCCNACTQCMLLRHEKASSPAGSDGYSLCHPTAFPL